MSGHLTTDVVLSHDGRELTLGGPESGLFRLCFDRPDDANALYELFQRARQRCWDAYADELADGRSPAQGPGPATRKVLAEIVIITEIAIENATSALEIADAKVLVSRNT